ncbi:MAG: hypothetical protein N2746_04305 [Deltaproteobacteria bacterium]|nr:hypothetical protein [Deltaproteobacteria bacterium]
MTRIFLISILLFPLNILFSSTFVYMELEAIADRSDAIIRGFVREVESRYNEEKTKIFTFAAIEVKEVIKGKVPPIVNVRTFGGRVGDVNMKVPGMPEFKKGEDVFLFLKKNEDVWHVTGMLQGKYIIEKDESGKEFLKNDFKGIVFKKVNADNKLEDMKPEEIPTRYEYLEFVAKLREWVSRKSREETIDKKH